MLRIVLFAVAVSMLSFPTQFAAAQGLSFGGVKVGTDNKSNDQSNNNDDENRNNGDNNNSNRNRNRRSNSNNSSDDESGDSNGQQFQQFFPGGQNKNNRGQNPLKQDGENQYRRSNNQGQIWNGGQNGITIGTWNGNKWNGSRKIESWTKQYGGNEQPFSSQWYKDHPKAWKYDNNKANIWVAASLPGVYSWLNWGNVPQQYQGNYGNVQQFDTSAYGNWYPLGVFSLMSGPGDSGTRIVQLAVDRNGQIAGNYYDMITNSSYNVSGNVRRQSQRAEWSLNKNQFVRFRAPIYQLLQPYGTMTVQLQGGQQQWQFVRLEN
jgi:hypothetical protein